MTTVASHPPVAAAAGAILQQCALVIDATSDADYADESKVVRGGSIGMHIRHTLDHYRSALRAQSALIDYDHRSRQTPIETDRVAAQTEIGELRTRLAVLGEPDVASPVTARVMLDGAGTEATLGSTLGRELWFCAHHAIHHLAIIKAIAGEHGVDLPGEIGMAPSTLNFIAQG